MPITLDGTTGITAPLLQNGNSNVAVAANGNVTISANGAVRMTIDTSGRMLRPNHPAFSAGRTAGNQSATQVIVYDSIFTNVGSHYNASTGVFTAPVAGSYFFYWYALNNQNSAATEVVLQVNGTQQADARQFASSNNNNSLSGSMLVNLNANDAVRTYIVTGTVYGLGSAYCRFGGYLIG